MSEWKDATKVLPKRNEEIWISKINTFDDLVNEFDKLEKTIKRLEDFQTKDGKDLGFLADKVLKLYEILAIDYKSGLKVETSKHYSCWYDGINCNCEETNNFPKILDIYNSQNMSTFEQIWDAYLSFTFKTGIDFVKFKEKFLDIMKNHNQKLLNKIN